MTADRLPAELADWPAWTPDEEQLGQLELLTSGAFGPLTAATPKADLRQEPAPILRCEKRSAWN